MIERIGFRWMGVLLALSFWPLEAAMHTYVFSRGDFLGNLFPADADELWMRGLISAAFIVFGLLGEKRLHDIEAFQSRIQAKRMRLQQILDSAYDAYVAIDSHGQVIAWNRSAEKMFGWPVGEAMGQSLAELIIPEDMRSSHVRGMQRYLESSVGPWLYRPVRTQAVRRDGSMLDVELVITPLSYDGRLEFFAFMREREGGPGPSDAQG